MELLYKGKNAIVTGASGGMGLEISRMLSESNINVLMLDLRSPSKNFLKENINCTFKKVETNPMSCWYIKNNRPFQFIKNNFCRRQDFPKAYSHHHYICGFDVKYLKKLNNELIFNKTFPILLDNKTSKKLIEIDTPEEMKKFKKINKK